MTHLKHYTCVVCLAKCEIEYEDGESYVQHTICPNCRSKTI